MKRVAYWRHNPHKFVEEYLALKLFLYQKILIYLMFKFPSFVFIACRGAGKSWLIAVYTVTLAILYPNISIVVVSGTQKQSSMLMQSKIAALYNASPAVRLELGLPAQYSKLGGDNPHIKFLNGSVIWAAAPTDSARGIRAQIIVVDEYRMLKNGIVKSIFEPMLVGGQRELQFKLDNAAKYKDYEEQSGIIYLSSAWYKAHWSWNTFSQHVRNMVDNKGSFAVSIPYQVPVYHGLTSVKAMSKIKDEAGANMDFMIEYEGVFAGDTEGGFFKLEDIVRNRTIQKTMVPMTDEQYAENQRLSKPKKTCNINKIKGEIRVISLDVALAGGSANDTSAIILMRLLPHGDSYHRHVAYIESVYDTIETDKLALKFRRLFEDFECDYAVMDAQSYGYGVYDALASVMIDNERDKEYMPWCSINDEAMKKRHKNSSALPVLYTVKANAQFNSDIAWELRNAFERDKIKLPISDIERKEQMISSESAKYLSMSEYEKIRVLSSYLQSSLLTSEMVSLKSEIVDGGKVRIKESGKSTKDRYTALAYANYYAAEIEKKLLTEESNEEDYGSFIAFI